MLTVAGIGRRDAVVLKRLTLFVLLILYGVTGSVAAFAPDDNCLGHRAPVVAGMGPVVDGGRSEQRPVDDGGNGCTGLCHHLLAAQLNSEMALPLAPLGKPGVVSAERVGWIGQVVGVPTPPPDVVSRSF